MCANLSGCENSCALPSHHIPYVTTCPASCPSHASGPWISDPTSVTIIGADSPASFCVVCCLGLMQHFHAFSCGDVRELVFAPRDNQRLCVCLSKRRAGLRARHIQLRLEHSAGLESSCHGQTYLSIVNLSLPHDAQVLAPSYKTTYNKGLLFLRAEKQYMYDEDGRQ